MEDWTPAMRRYEIRARAEPIVRAYVDALPYDAPVVMSDIGCVGLDEFTEEDINPAITRILDEMCCEDGSLIRTEDGWLKKSEDEMREIMEVLIVQHHKDNREWYVGCVLMAVLGIMWVVSHLWGTDLGMREFPMTMFGIPMTLYDTILIDGLMLMAAYKIFDKIANPT